MAKEIQAKSINEAIGTIIAKLCYRGADAIGSEFSERTNQWRAENAYRLLEKANKIYDQNAITGRESVHPRLAHRIIDSGSWIDDDRLQDMWAGLLASSCTEDGNDESNLIFTGILSQITSAQSKVINHGCENADKKLSKAGWLFAELYEVDLEDLVKISEVEDFHRIDRELDHLRSLDLIGGSLGGGGFGTDSTSADITPKPLALQLYVKCQGFGGSPTEFFGFKEDA